MENKTPLFIRCQPGDDLSGSAGARRGTVHLKISEDGTQALIGERRIRLQPCHLVYWHRGSAGTYRGIVDPQAWVPPEPKWEEFEAGSDEDWSARQWAFTEAKTEFMRSRFQKDHDLRGRLRLIEECSSSGAGDIAAVIVRVSEPLGILTSGYRGRGGWHIRVYEPDGQGGIRTVFDGPLKDWRAQNAPLEDL